MQHAVPLRHTVRIDLLTVCKFWNEDRLSLHMDNQRSCFTSLSHWVLGKSYMYNCLTGLGIFLESKHGRYLYSPYWRRWMTGVTNPQEPDQGEHWITYACGFRHGDRRDESLNGWGGIRSIFRVRTTPIAASEATYRQITATRCLSLICKVAGKALYPAKTSAMSAFVAWLPLRNELTHFTIFSSKNQLKGNENIQ